MSTDQVTRYGMKSQKIKRKHKRSNRHVKDIFRYWEPTDMPSTSHNAFSARKQQSCVLRTTEDLSHTMATDMPSSIREPLIPETHNIILNNFEQESLGHNSTFLEANPCYFDNYVHTAAPELDAVDYDMPNNEFDSIAAKETDSIGYAVPVIEIDSFGYAMPTTDLNAIEYAEEFSGNINITYNSPLNSMAIANEKVYESQCIKTQTQETSNYQESTEPFAKKQKKKSGLSKLNIFGLVRKKYKKCFSAKTYGWDKSTSWTKVNAI